MRGGRWRWRRSGGSSDGLAELEGTSGSNRQNLPGKLLLIRTGASYYSSRMRRCDKRELNILQARFFFFSIGKGFIFFYSLMLFLQIFETIHPTNAPATDSLRPGRHAPHRVIITNNLHHSSAQAPFIRGWFQKGNLLFQPLNK